MSVILTALVPVFLIIALGVVLRRSLLPDPSHWAALERLTYFILFPALLIVSAVKADLSKVNVLAVVETFMGTILVLCFGILVAHKPLMRWLKVDGPAFSSLFQGSVRWNTYIVLAVAGGLYGPGGITVAAVALVALIPVINVFAVTVLTHFASSEPPTMRRVFGQLLANPYIWACLVGGLINYTALPVPKVVVEFGEILGRASLALGLLVVGGGLAVKQLVRPKPVVYLTAVLKLLVKPALACVFGILLGLTPVELGVVVVVAAAPAASASYVLARQLGGDAPLLAEILTVEVIAAAVTMPLVVAAARLVSP